MYGLGSFDRPSSINFTHANHYFLLSEQVTQSGFLINNLLKSILSKQHDLFVISEDLDIVIESIQKPDIDTFKLLEQHKRLHFFETAKTNKENFSLKYFQQLFKELKVYPQFKHANCVIHLSGAVLNATDETELENIINYFNRQAVNWQLNLIILITGASNRALTERLFTYSKTISGLLNISRYSGSQLLNLSFWHQVSGLIYNQKFKLYFDENLFKLSSYVAPSESESTEFDNQQLDENEVWVVETAVDSFEQIPENYRRVKNNEQLYEVAKQLSSATVVFTINKDQSVIDLAKICYTLRKTQGAWLKIVLQNIEGMVRHKDESIFTLRVLI